MHNRKSHTLEHKFLLSLGLAGLVLCVVFSFIFYVHMRGVVEEQVRDKAELVFAQIDAIQGYVRETLRPSMFKTHPGEFFIEGMSSSFISRNIMERMGDKAVGHVYRRVAIGARNPASEADELERSLIERFRAREDETQWAGTLNLRGTDHFVITRQVRFTAECMPCHGVPGDAPPELIRMYGERGFGHKLDSIDGLDFVAFPVGSSEAQLKGVITSYFILFVLCATFFFATAFFVFRVLVVRRLHDLAASFRKTLGFDGQSRALERLDGLQEGDEVEEIVERFEDVAHHLAEARNQLQAYADNLRDMVDARTEALSQEAAERRADVSLFVQLLEDMRGTHTRERLWRGALPQIAKRFGTRRVGYVCTFVSHNHYVWPSNEPLPELPEPLTPLLTEGRVHVFGTRVFVPVEAQDGATEGLLCLEWATPEEAARQNMDVLRALGRQLGTVAENISALDRMMRQMDLLQAVFDGVGDPLALLDAKGRLVIANDGARRLATELGGTDGYGNLLAPLLGASCETEIEAVAHGGAVLHREVQLDDGRSFSVQLYPLPRVEERPGRVAAYIHETTAERRMLARVNQSERMATVGKLSAGLAHEINNPLGVILCYAELLRQGATAEQRDDLGIILRHTRQAQKVLRDLLDFARPKAFEGVLTDAAGVARRMAEVFGPQAAHRGGRVQVEAEDGLPPARIGEQALEQILSNLLLNAIDALTGEDGLIRIRLRSHGLNVRIDVEDNGLGVETDALQRVFDPFYTTKETGTGLGLSVVYGIVTDAGGTAEVLQSHELGGAVFRVTLPAGTAPEAGATEEKV